MPLPCLRTHPQLPDSVLFFGHPFLQAKYGDEAAKQIAARRQREAELAAGGEDANLIPLGVRVRNASLFFGMLELLVLAAGGEDANLTPLGVRVSGAAARVAFCGSTECVIAVACSFWDMHSATASLPFLRSCWLRAAPSRRQLWSLFPAT